MQFRPTIDYPANEKPILDKLEHLFSEWHQHFASPSSGLGKQVADRMVLDGFFPHYFSQKKQILFIGREARWISGKHNIDVLYPCYRETKHIGSQHINNDNMHSRMIHIASGILNGKLAYDIQNALPMWKSIDYADKIGDTFGEVNGLSFAFMNFSKFSNDDDWPADWDTINMSYKLSTQNRNFIQEEVEILKPHIIIAMTLKGGGHMIDSLGQKTPIHASNLAKSYWLNSGGHGSLLIETSHFAKPGGNDITDFYIPICDAISRSGLK